MIEPSVNVLLRRPDTFAARLLSELRRELDRPPTTGEIHALAAALGGAMDAVIEAAPAPPSTIECMACDAGAPCIAHDALIAEGRDR